MKYNAQLTCKTAVLFAFFALFSLATLNAQGWLEIHQLNIGQGDAAIILTRNRDTSINKIAIVDFGRKFSDDLVGRYIENTLKYKGDIDYAIVSHYDVDHYYGFYKFADQYLNENGKKIKTFIIPGGFGPGILYPKGGVKPGTSDWNPMLPERKKARKSLTNFVDNIRNTNFVSNVVQISELKSLNANICLDVIEGIPVDMELVAGVQYIKNKSVRVLSNTSYNDDCLAWVLHFGQFRFYTGGDLGGTTGISYVDHETPLADYFISNTAYNANSLNTASKGNTSQGHVCLAKVNHHGSEESSNKKFVETLNPSVWLISCGRQRGFNHPTTVVLDRILKGSNNPTSEEAKKGIAVTCLPYKVDSKKLTSRFSNTSKFWYAYSWIMTNKTARSSQPEGTYKIVVRPYKKTYSDEEEEGMVDSVSITKRSIFTVEYLYRAQYDIIVPTLVEMNCHDN